MVIQLRRCHLHSKKNLFQWVATMSRLLLVMVNVNYTLAGIKVAPIINNIVVTFNHSTVQKAFGFVLQNDG